MGIVSSLSQAHMLPLVTYPILFQAGSGHTLGCLNRCLPPGIQERQCPAAWSGDQPSLQERALSIILKQAMDIARVGVAFQLRIDFLEPTRACGIVSFSVGFTAAASPCLLRLGSCGKSQVAT